MNGFGVQPGMGDILVPKGQMKERKPSVQKGFSKNKPSFGRN